MKSKSHLEIFYLLCVLFSLASCSCGPGEETISVARGVAQLFIDDELIESQHGLVRTLHQPVKEHGGNRPIIALEDEFEGYAGTLTACNILYDPRLKKYVMYASAFSSHWRALEKERRWEFSRLYRFTSADGMHWIKGDDGRPQRIFPLSKDELYDPASGAYATHAGGIGVYYDRKDEAYPYKGWRYFANWGDDREGFYYVQSRDGIHWERGRQIVNAYAGPEDPYYRLIRQDGRTLAGPGDASRFYYDHATDRILGIFKFYSPQKVEFGNRLRSRTYIFFDPPLSKPFDIRRIDHVELVPPAAKDEDDEPYDEYYDSTAWRYESLWLGGLKIWHSQGDYPWSAAGCAFMKLIVSRDGMHWTKVNFANEDGHRGIFVPNGEEGGNNGRNDGGYMTEFSCGPLRIGNQLIYYYACSSWGKNHPDSIRISGGGIFRARLRIDGFVSVDEGSLTTKLLSFAGDTLYVNAIGPVTVHVLTPRGEVVGTRRIEGDSIRHLVAFGRENLFETLQGRLGRLRFTVGKGGRLYSFTIV